MHAALHMPEITYYQYVILSRVIFRFQWYHMEFTENTTCKVHQEHPPLRGLDMIELLCT